MANREICSLSSPEFSFLMPALAVGTSVNVTAIPNYNGATSKIVGVVRAVPAGPAPGQVVAVQGSVAGTIGPPATTGLATITLNSLSAPGDDSSEYRVFFVNEVASSGYATVQTC